MIFESRSQEEITEEQNFIMNIEKKYEKTLFNVFDYINKKTYVTLYVLKRRRADRDLYLGLYVTKLHS